MNQTGKKSRAILLIGYVAKVYKELLHDPVNLRQQTLIILICAENRQEKMQEKIYNLRLICITAFFPCLVFSLQHNER